MSNEIQKGKEVAYYSAIVQAWINTRMECDKSLLTLSAAALGLIVTLITSVGINSILLAIFYTASVFFFLFALIVGIKIFRWNSEYLEKIAKDEQEEEECWEKCLKKWDKRLFWSFIAGVSFMLIVGIIYGKDHFNQSRCDEMENKKSKQNNQKTIRLEQSIGRFDSGLLNLKN